MHDQAEREAQPEKGKAGDWASPCIPSENVIILLVKLEIMDEKIITFSGEVTANVEEEFRNLYYKPAPLYRIVFAVMGIVALVMAIVSLSTEDLVIHGIIILFSALGLFVAAFRLGHIWWRWWWPRFLATFGRHLYGEVTSVGIKFRPNGNLVEWKHFVDTKQANSLILLYFDKSSAYPIHQSMVSDPSEWMKLVALIKGNIRRKILYL